MASGKQTALLSGVTGFNAPNCRPADTEMLFTFNLMLRVILLLNILFLGLVSFFTDVGTEMIYPIIPLYLTSAFGATPLLIGTIEGIAESLAGLLRVFSGYISDRFQKKKALAAAGYSASLLNKVMLLVAASWGGILFARIIDRFGKGIRTAPRDVLVAESAGANGTGKAFGLHKALDMAGSALGVLLTYFILSGSTGGLKYKKLFLISVIPAILGVCMFFFVREKKTPRPPKRRERFWKNIKNLNRQLKLYLVVVFLFTLGNSSNAFLLLKAKSVGFDDVNVVLLYFVCNATAAVLSFPLGRLSDRVGRKGLLVAGYLIFAVVYVGFGLGVNQPFMVGMFVLYGLFTALTAGVERAYVAEIAPPDLKGTMLGLHSSLVGIALLPASIIFGALWTAFGSLVPFLFGAGLSLAAALLLLFFMKNQKADA